MAKISAYSEQTDPDNDDYFIMVRAGVNYKIKRATVLEYTPGTPGDWGSPEPGSIQEALDALAATSGGSLPADGDYGDIIVSSSGTVWTLESAALTSLTGLTPTADGLPYYTGGSSAALTTLTSFARLLLDDTDAATMRATLDLEPGTDVQAYDADLATIAGLTATTDNFMQAKSSAWASRTPAQVTTDLQGTGLAADTVGFRGIPQVTFSAATTIAATHEGKDLVHPASDANARTITIDSNANLALPVGFAFSGYNDTSQAVTIAITADTLVWIGTGGTGSRTVAQYGSWVCRKIDTTRWVISGVNIT
jgi:hypothetical protein